MPPKTLQFHNREARDPHPALPQSLLDHLTPDTAPHQTVSTTRATPPVTRRQLRKQRRLQKRRTITTAQKLWKDRRQNRAQDSTQHTAKSDNSKKRQRDSTTSGAAAATAPPPPLETVLMGKPAEEVQHIDSVQPFKKTKKVPPSVKSPAEESARLEDDPDARQVKRLEKLLGIKRRRKRNAQKATASSSYANIFGEGDDDLVDILQFCDQREKKNAANGKAGQESLSSQESVHDSMDDRTEQQRSASQQDNSAQPRVMRRSHSTDESEDSNDALGNSASVQEITEDSPACDLQRKPEMRLLSPGGAANKPASARDSSVRKVSKYVPPSARKRGDRSTDAVKRRLRGLLNRVADVNASGIADDLVRLFHTPDDGLSRRQLATLYANAALDSSRDGSGVGRVNPYVQSHAAIAAHLGKHVDGVTLATLVVLSVRRTVATLGRIDVVNGAGPDAELDLVSREEAHDEAFGYVAMICALYTRRGVTSRIVYDLIKLVADNLNGVRLELLLFILRQVGGLLRMDDPAGLKHVITFIHERSAELPRSNNHESADSEDKSDTKVQIMLDFIDDIKNNKIRKTDLKEDQIKFAWAEVPDTPLDASINDLLDDDFVDMRWWDETKGLSIAERRGLSTAAKHLENGDASAAIIADEGPDLSTLASSLRLNTDYRRALFRAIMSSVNLVEACDRLENMGAFDAKKGHDRDTALVILHCCASEKDFNPFYAALAERVCLRSRRLRFTFEFALWDVFKSIPGSAKVTAMPKRKVNNYVRLLSHLWVSSALSLSVLRCVADFEEFSEVEQVFFTNAVVLTMRKLCQRADDRLALFEKLSSETWNGIDDFRVSLALFLRRSVISHLSKEEQSVASQAIEILERGTAG